ncbi:MAG: UDP-N-acetylmuramoyl-L-alanine--D-glutamate ligase, partial [Ignavibacteriae bacterium]|nr:UDP-N-acetylmuramoyl-L-alanine--D-glutamate ligase [Ignavibacteriota bacterium]
MNIKGNKISILGAVRSGISSAKLAAAKGAIPFVSDMSDNLEIRENLSVLDELNIKYELGLHSEKVFDCDFIITSPGVPSNSEVIVKALSKGIKVISEIEFAYWFCEGNIIAISGTNGKTTTTSLCAHLLNSAGINCFSAGNIGIPFSEIV